MRTFTLAPGILEATARALRSYGSPGDPHEGVAFWAGTEDDNKAMVTCVIAPRAKTSRGRWSLTDPAAVGKCIRSHGLVYLGQVHSHPPEADAVHSWGDDDDAYLKFEGMVSIVVADHARSDRDLIPVEAAGVHLFEDGAFRLLRAAEVRARFQVAPAGQATIIDMRKA